MAYYCNKTTANASIPELTTAVRQAAVEICRRLTPWARDYGYTMAQLAIAWTVANPALTSAICGAKTPAQAIENCEAGRWHLSEQDMLEIENQIEDLSPGISQHATQPGGKALSWLKNRFVALWSSGERICRQRECIAGQVAQKDQIVLFRRLWTGKSENAYIGQDQHLSASLAVLDQSHHRAAVDLGQCLTSLHGEGDAVVLDQDQARQILGQWVLSLGPGTG